MAWEDTFNAVFFTGLATTVFIFLGTLVKYGFKSKCDSVKLCCGLLEVHRRVELESSDEESPTSAPTASSSSSSSSSK